MTEFKIILLGEGSQKKQSNLCEKKNSNISGCQSMVTSVITWARTGGTKGCENTFGFLKVFRVSTMELPFTICEIQLLFTISLT